MADIWTPEKRREVMSRIRSRDTLPERLLRAALRRAGMRYRSHRKVRRVTVDLVLPDLHAVVQVHGCFWHGCAEHYRSPGTNAGFWRRKLEQNRLRDRRQITALRRAGWRVVVVWEHSIRATAPDKLPTMVSRMTAGRPSAGGRSTPSRRTTRR